MVLNQRSSSPAVEITGTVVLERLFDILGLLAIFFSRGAMAAARQLVSRRRDRRRACCSRESSSPAGVLAIFGERPLRVPPWPLRRFSPLTRASDSSARSSSSGTA